jgi:lipopolysaccharide export system permease protein
LKKIDFYIIGKFLATFFFSISLLIIVVIIFDISEKIDDFLDRSAPLNEIIFSYYLNFIPYFINLFSPLFTFIAVIFFTSKMASNTEIIAILSSGVSFKRMLLPYLISSLILMMMTFYLANFVIPYANKTRLAFEEAYLKNPYNNSGRNIHFQLNPGEMIYVESYNNSTNIGRNFTYEKFNENGLYYKLWAESIKYDTLSGRWELNKIYQRFINGLDENLNYIHRIDTNYSFTPDKFKIVIKNVDVMGYYKLREFIQEQESLGSPNVKFYLVEKHKRFAFPFATVILTLIGVSLSSRKTRGGLGFHLAAGISLSFAFILFMQISTTFASHGTLSPFIAVWIPNVLFAIVGVILMRKAPK